MDNDEYLWTEKTDTDGNRTRIFAAGEGGKNTVLGGEPTGRALWEDVAADVAHSYYKLINQISTQVDMNTCGSDYDLSKEEMEEKIKKQFEKYFQMKWAL